jgi:4-coumarate--CoA ligase
MPIHSRWQVPIDVCSLPTYLFGSPTASLPDKIAFYDADRPDTHYITFDAFRLWSQRFAAGLQKSGLKPGDRVLLFSSSNLYFPLAFMGVLMAGGVFTGANPGFVARELAYQLKDSDAKFLLCADASLELGVEAAESVGISKDRIFRFDDTLFDGTAESRLGVKNWASLMQSEEVGRNFSWYEPEDPKDAICCLNYSSGTTGVPKGVMITHYSYVANATQFSHLAQLHPDEPERRKNSLVLQLPTTIPILTYFRYTESGFASSQCTTPWPRPSSSLLAPSGEFQCIS